MENINKVIKENCKKLNSSNKTFEDIYGIMFRFEDDVMAEKSTMIGIKEYTYGEVRAKVEKIAAAIHQEVQTTGKYIGLCADNGVEWIVVFWAILRSGNHPYLINLRQPESFTTHILETLGAEYVICVDKVKDYGKKALQYEALEQLSEDLKELQSVVFGNELAITTSATTLKEKICIYTGENFANQVLNSEQIVKQSKLIKKHYKGRLKQLAFLPLYHIFGLSAVYFWFCFFGRTLVFLPNYTPDAILSTIRKHEVTHVFAVPLLWHTIEKSVLREIAARDEETQKKFEKGLELSVKLQSISPVLGKKIAQKLLKEVRNNLFGESVQFCISGGSYIKNSSLHLLNALGYPLHNGYGMSEIGITSVELGRNIKDRLKASIGIPFQSVQYKIDEDGTLLVKGNSLCDRMIVNNEVIPMNEWFSTDDVMMKENDGRYYISGRTSDVVLGDDGENLNPDFAEQGFALSCAKNFCVTGNEEKNKLILIIQIAPDLVKLQKEKLLREIAECNSQLPTAYQVKEVFYTYDSIQSENAIKVSRAYIANGIVEGKIKLFKDINEKKKGSASEKTEIKAVIRGIFARTLMVNPESIEDEDHFLNDLGGTSLDYFAVLGEINEKFGMKISFEDNEFTYSIKDFERIVKGYLEK